MTRIPRFGRIAAAAAVSAVAGLAARDALQREHTVLRNFPLIGHARHLLETGDRNCSPEPADLTGKAVPRSDQWVIEEPGEEAVRDQ